MIKANELMLGDWVHNFSCPKKVVAIYDNGFLALESDYVGRFHEMACEPIPLTKEILKKNGMDDSDCSFRFKEDENYCLEIAWLDDGFYWTINLAEYDIIPLRYVHELQHALKLCKINKEITL